jgi:hypothetical protein
MRTLPVLDAFGHAVRSTISNIRFAFYVSWPWVVIMLPVNIGSNLYLLSHHEPTSPALEADVAVVSFAATLLGLLSFASIAVNWHRYVLRDEVPSGFQRLRFDNLVWRYFGNLILIGLAAIGISLPINITLAIAVGIAESMAGHVDPILVVVLVLAFIANLVFAFVSSYRFGVKLPGVALGRTDYGIGDAWRDTAGNFWKFLGLVTLFVLCVGFASLVLFGLDLILSAGGGALGTALGISIQVVVSWIVQILGVTLLTSLYGFFVENRDF